MNITLILAAIAACALVLFSFGCTANRPYRTNTATCVTDPPGPDCSNAVIESTPDYKLGFVEFDDQGWFWSHEQLKAVTKMIQDQGHIASNEARGIIIALFVHGWKNNSDFNNTNVVNFRKALQNLNKAEKIQSDLDKRKPRQIVGVYAGWRGLSARIEPFKELSFYERKNTAHKVGGYGALTRLLIDLENLQKAANQRIGQNETRTELIIVGHSFGGGAVYSALSQIVLERFQQTIEQGHPLKPLGDQVILLNPAFEASRHYNLNKLATSIEKYPESQRPVLSIFTSEGDWATHWFFPLGRFFSTLFEKHRPDQPQRAANLQAVGWFEPFITHHLVYDTNAVASASSHTTYNPQLKHHEPHDEKRLRESAKNVQSLRALWRPNAPAPATYSFDDCILKPKASYRPGDPILVVSVDKKIMKDHDDIFDPVMVNFLREYIEFCRRDRTQAGE